VPRLDWLAQMIAPFDDSRVVGVKGAYATHEQTLVSRLIQADFDEQYRRLGRFDTVDVVDGYSAAFRRSVFLGSGGFDTTFAAGHDVELSYRLAQGGHRLVFAPKACVYHYHGESFRPFLERALRAGLWRSLVSARHPHKARDDATTADDFRTQLPLAGLTVASLLLGTRWRRFLPLAGLCAATFATSAVPTAWRSRRAGTDVVFAFPGLHFVRVLALGTGMTIGTLALGWQQFVERVSRLTRAMRRS
jgi:cellulose synthase/poly-beta-1,6-N-acetylglucosamine synthase-like glycosyltransferase